MKLDKKSKKIIAREFIVFAITLVLTLFAFIYTVISNYSTDKAIKELHSQFVKNVQEGDNLSKSLKDKQQNQNWFYNRVNEQIDISGAGYTIDKLWKNFQRLAEHDSIAYRYKVWEKDTKDAFITIGFTSPDKLQGFIQRNTINQTDILNNEISSKVFARNNPILKKISQREKTKFTSADQRIFSLNSFLIVVIILFGLRYFYYGVMWSIKILKEK